MNITPILWIKGKVRQVTTREVAAFPGVRGGNDPETGRYVQPQAPRPAYDVLDVTVDTDPGGLVTVSVQPEAMEAVGGEQPSVGDMVEVPVRAFDLWQGPEGRRYRTKGYSLAGEVQRGWNATGGARALSNAS